MRKQEEENANGNSICILSTRFNNNFSFKFSRYSRCYGQIAILLLNLRHKTMITLNRKLKKEHTEPNNGLAMEPVQRRISIRDKLLVKEVQEMNENLPVTCSVSFEDPNVLSEFVLAVAPDEGYWQGGTFKFSVSVTDDYNMAPPKVKCQTQLWHPNINVDGDICLSLLRQTSIDEHGWAPTRRLKDVVWGLNSLFTDLLNFDDPLNIEAAEMYKKNKIEFQTKVTEYIAKNKR